MPKPRKPRPAKAAPAPEVWTIQPLEWEGDIREPFDSIRAPTPFGSYNVRMQDDRTLRWEYCFDEYYDEDSNECETVEEGKAAAWAHWQERIGRALVKYRLAPAPKRGGGH